MKFKAKLKKKRKEWIKWLLDDTDEVNGSIDEKFEGVINHALEEHSIETIEELKKQIKGRLQNLCESAWDDEDEMIEFLFT